MRLLVLFYLFWREARLVLEFFRTLQRHGRLIVPHALKIWMPPGSRKLLRLRHSLTTRCDDHRTADHENCDRITNRPALI